MTLKKTGTAVPGAGAQLLAASVIFLLPLFCSHRYSPEIDFPAMPDSLGISESCYRITRHLDASRGRGDGAAVDSFWTMLDSVAESLRGRLGDQSGSPAAAEAIVAVVYDAWGMAFDPRDTLLDALMPHVVFRNRKGSCLGVSLIILMLAEKIACPVYGVILPGHFFCRYDNGQTRFNIEPNRRGYRHPDSYYRQRYAIHVTPWYDLRSLTGRETIGILCYNAGNLFMAHHNPQTAQTYFQEAVIRVPGHVESWGNWALSYARLGHLDTAEALFSEIFRDYPGFRNLAANFGAVAMQAGHFHKAAQIYRRGLEYVPGDPRLREGLAEAVKRTGE